MQDGTNTAAVFRLMTKVHADWKVRYPKVPAELFETSNRAEVAAKVMSCVYQARNQGQPQSRLLTRTRGVGKVRLHSISTMLRSYPQLLLILPLLLSFCDDRPRCFSCCPSQCL